MEIWGTWDTWKLLIGILIVVVNVGAIGGVIVGKSLAKRARPDYKPLLSRKERIAYSVSVLLGLALILFGFFYPFPSGDEAAMPDEGIFFADEAVPGEENFAAGDDSIAYNA